MRHLLRNAYLQWVRAMRNEIHHLFSKRKWRELASTSIIGLELGSGPKPGKNGWTTVDVWREADMVWDLLRGIPLHDHSLSPIYSSQRHKFFAQFQT